jgi:transposase InsO family protein
MDLKKSKKIIDLKEEAKHLYHHGDQNIHEIAEELNKSQRTIYRWLKLPLKDKDLEKKDQPLRKSRQGKISEATYNRIYQLKEENPKRSAEKIRSILQTEECKYLPSETSIRRFLLKKGMGRVAGQSRQGYIVFQREKPNELWQIDIAGIQTVGHLGQLYLFAVIDDCSRFVPAAFYAPNEKGVHVIRLLQEAILTHGRPIQILADNGTQFKNTLGELGTKYTKLLHLLDIDPIFARVRHPQTKGKLERFFGTIKSSFLSEARLIVAQNPEMNLPAFNELLKEWLEFYNTCHRHRSLPHRCSPNTIYFDQSRRIYRPIEVAINWERWIADLDQRLVSKQNFIHFRGAKYPVPPGFAGLKVELMIYDQKFQLYRDNLLIQEYSLPQYIYSKNRDEIRLISKNGTFGYKGKYYNLDYKMAGQQIRVSESADGKELHIYYEDQLIRKIPLE